MTVNRFARFGAELRRRLGRAPSSLADNTIWYGAVTILGVVVGLLMSVILARGLGPRLMGDYSYLLWVSRLLTTVATLALGVATVRYTAASFAGGQPEEARGFVRTFLRWQTRFTAIVIVVAAALVMALGSGALRGPLLLVVVFVVPYTIETIFTSALYGAQRYDLTAKTSALKMLGEIVVAALAIATGTGLVGILVGLIVVTTLSCALQAHRVATVYPQTASPVPQWMKPEVRRFAAATSAALVLDAVIWDRSEVFFLRMYSSSEAIAYYSLAFGLATKAMLLPEIIPGALLPALSALHARGARSEFQRVYKTAWRYAALTAAPLAVAGAVVAPAIMPALYTGAYAASIAPFQLLVGIAVFVPIRKVVWASLGAVVERRYILGATAVGAVADVALAAWLIPLHGIMGAIIANGIAQGVATSVGVAAMTMKHGYRLPVRDVLGIALAAVSAFLLGWWSLGAAPTLWRAAGAAAVALVWYVGACIALRQLTRAEWNFFLRLVRAGRSTPPTSLAAAA